MGGLMHLFDFNQTLSGRKLPSDKKSKSGSQPMKKIPDAKDDFGEDSKLNAPKSGDSQYEHELSNVKTSRKSNGRSIKTLIKQDSMKVPDIKNHTPSVIARLMGLEALPLSSKTDQKTHSTSSKTLHKERSTSSKTLPRGSTGNVIANLDEKPSNRITMESQHHLDKSSCNAGQHSKMVKPTVITGQYTSNELNLPQNCMEGDENGSGTLHFRNYPQEQQVEELRKDFDALQSWQTGHLNKSARNKNASSHQNDKHPICNRKMHQTDLAEKHSTSRITTLEGRYKKSREFQDAMNFLQTNKDFFVKFIRESKFLFPGDDQEDSTGSDLLPYPSQTVNARYSHPMPDESCGQQPWAKDSSKSRMDYRGDNPESSTEDPTVDANEFNIPESISACSEDSLCQQQCADPSLEHCANYQMPTRIVVLKPSPGRTKHLKPLSPTYSCISKDHVAKSTLLLEKVWEKQWKDKEHEYYVQSACSNKDEYYADVLNDRKEVAREIARKARENLSRDHMTGSMNPKNGYNISDQLNNGKLSQSCWTDQEAITTIDGLNRENLELLSSSMLPNQVRKLTSEDAGRRDKTEVSCQAKEKVASSSDKINQYVDSSPTSKDSYNLNCSPELRNSRSSKGFERTRVDRSQSKERYRRALFNSQNNECMNSSPNNHLRYVEKSKMKHCIGFLTASSELSQEGPHIYNNRINLEDCPGMALESVENFLKPADEILLKPDLSIGISDLKLDQMLLEGDDSDKQNEELLGVHVKQQCPHDPDSLIVGNNLCLSSSITSGADKKVIEGSDTVCGVSDEREVLHGCGAMNIIGLLDNSHNNEDRILEESESIQPSVKNISLIENIGTLKVEPEKRSPVSILDFPDDEEASVSREYKEMNSDLQEVQTSDRLLHFDIHYDDHDNDILPNDSCLAEEETECNEHMVIQCTAEVIDDEVHHMDFHLQESNCSSGNNAELAYVRDLLASGLIGKRTLLYSWNSPLQLVNSNVFEKMENNYLGKKGKFPSQSRKLGAMLSLSQRRLLFDSVNEILCSILEPHLTSSKPIVSDIEIFKHVCLHIDRLLCPYTNHQYTLDYLVTNDVCKKGQWFDNGLEVDELGLEMERAIIDDLIEELLLII